MNSQLKNRKGLNKMGKILLVFGTRPEAIKMCPLVLQLKKSQADIKVCVTGQHREMLDQVLEIFNISPDIRINVMREGQSLNALAGRLLNDLQTVFSSESPDLVIVHGDTTTASCAALAAYNLGIKVAHVEAGLRTDNLFSPWPEEGNRRLIGALASYHFAPTNAAKDALLLENIGAENILVTGNTVIDALLHTVRRVRTSENEKCKSKFSFLDDRKKLIVVTVHRRENFGAPLNDICDALLALVDKHKDIQIVLPVHPNPNVRKTVECRLSENNNIFLVEPLPYLEFTYLLDRARLILTDSGGIQEEAPSLGKPVLVLRTSTERPEAVEVGTVKLVGSDTTEIIKYVEILKDDTDLRRSMTTVANPYGDGNASEKIVNFLRGIL